MAKSADVVVLGLSRGGVAGIFFAQELSRFDPSRVRRSQTKPVRTLPIVRLRRFNVAGVRAPDPRGLELPKNVGDGLRTSRSVPQGKNAQSRTLCT